MSGEKVEEQPCPENGHDYYPNYLVYINCGTPYCSGRELHCKTCGWFIMECGCGSNNGASKISHKSERSTRKIKTTGMR